ncbi:glycosyltransferase [Paenibacillus chitinolyticus]|uniref:glycosyltransferase n=1 Tax=Paenibacillus chitinolyticus TaxID=79263 RepID=UPI0036729EB0
MKTPNISLCMIVKNEERSLERCLESAKDLVSEIIIVDTGSTDQTVEIAKQYTDKIFYFEWINDFAAARNYALDQATGEYILHLDADEYLQEGRDNLKGDLDKDFYFLRIRNQLGMGHAEIHQFVRLFRNHPSLRYEGTIHEQINLEKNANMSNAFMETLINHDGYLEEVVKDKNKAKRNMDIIKEALKTEPTSFNYYNLGLQHLHSGHYEQAIDAFKKSYALANNQTFTPRMLNLLIKSLIELKRFKEALEVATDCIKLFPEDTDMLYQVGIIYTHLKYMEDAKNSFEKCLEIGEERAGLSFNHNEGTGSYLASTKLSSLYLVDGDHEKAQKYFLMAVEKAPDLVYLIKLFIKLHPNLSGIDFLAGMVKLWPFTETERIQQFLTMLYQYRHPATLDLIECYGVECPNEVRAWLEVVKGNYKEAKQIWGQLDTVPEGNSRDILLLSFISQDFDLMNQFKSIFNVREKDWKWWKSIISDVYTSDIELSPKSEGYWKDLCMDLMQLQRYDCVERLIAITQNPKLRYYIAKQFYKNGIFDLALDVILESNKQEDNLRIYSLVRDILTRLDQVDDAIYYADKVYNLAKDFDSAYRLLLLLQRAGMIQESRALITKMKSIKPISPWISLLPVTSSF